MSVHKDIKRNTIEDIRAMKGGKNKIAMLTAYDYTMAKMADAGGLDAILVGDSAANLMAGFETTLPITLAQMIYHAQAVVRGTKKALIVVDLPFGAYQSNPKKALKSAVRVMKETGAQAIKIEGGIEIKKAAESIIAAGIPVMGHLGLTPQSINQFGGFGLRAKENDEAEKLKKDALLLEQIGAFAIVLEKIPAVLAKEVTESLQIPTIGIGAGVDCDGQILVIQDMLGMNKGFKPKFLRQYANLYEEITTAIGNYVTEVKAKHFPNEKESY